MASRPLLLLAIVVSLSVAHASREIPETPFPFEVDGNFRTFIAPVVPSDSVGPLPQLHRAFASRAVTLQVETGKVSVEIWSTTPDDVNCNKIDLPQEPVAVPVTPAEATAEATAVDSNATETTSCSAAAAPAVPMGPVTLGFHLNATCEGRSCVYTLNPNVVHCVRLHNATEEVVKGTIVAVSQTRFEGFFVLLMLGLNYYLARKATEAPDCRSGVFYKVASFVLVATVVYDLYSSAPKLANYFHCTCVRTLVRVLAGGVAAMSVTSWCAAEWAPHKRAWSTIDFGQLCGFLVTGKCAMSAAQYWSPAAQMTTALSVFLFSVVVYKMRRPTNIYGPVVDITRSEYENMDQAELAKLYQGRGDVAAWHAACHPDRLMEEFGNDPDRFKIPSAAPTVKKEKRQVATATAGTTSEQARRE